MGRTKAEGEKAPRDICYINREERAIKGMYYVRSFNSTEQQKSASKHTKWYVVMAPEQYIVKPALDYLVYLYQQKRKSQSVLQRIAISICHFYNFLRVSKLSGEEPITLGIIEGLIKYLSVIPKELKGKLRGRFNNQPIEPWNIQYLPIHPYIEPTNMRSIIEILKEWYTTYWCKKKEHRDKISFFVNPKEYKFHEDEVDWRYPYEYIKESVNDILDFLKYLSETNGWKHRYQAIPPSVAKPQYFINRYNGESYCAWDVNNRIKKITGLKETKPQRKKVRILFEDELKRLFTSKMLNEHSQRKLLFSILLLSGARISELLNVLVKHIRITVPDNAFTNEEKKLKAIIHWEDLFVCNNFDKNDIIINEHLEFELRIAKRIAYEVSGVRANKSSSTRFVRLYDYFELPKLLNLDCESIFVTPKQIINCFREDIILEKLEQSPERLIPKIMDYHKRQLIRGIHIDDKEYDPLYKNWIERIRLLLDSCWFGALLKEYLVERKLIVEEVAHKKTLLSHYLFLNMRNNKGFPITPNTIREYWFNKICEQEGIERYGVPVNDIVMHYKKGDITVHSFRHTYISMRIKEEGLKGDFNRINLANLKKDVGHVPSSEVAETVYYFADSKYKAEVYTKVFAELKTHLTRITLTEQDAGT
ncbi:hypothetical protein [Priestia endophytica]|uniref:hypothetical protein n=1 Tax=Priestia endophytica TaxID=135735 RepID=UPI000DCA7377|nr:hypothetical protein [Priestia endophytica]RAS83085.1 hypothetical protein A4R27_08040 [Priestia endophytica]